MVSDMDNQGVSTSPARRFVLLGGAALVLVVLGVVGWWLTRDDAPEAASLETATASLSDEEPVDEPTTDDTAADDDGAPADDDGAAADAVDDAAADDDAATDDAASTGDGIEGAWTVDTSVGEFSFGDSTGTFVGFRVAEELSGLGEIEAVGRTPSVTGTVTIEGTSATAASIEADLAAITTDDSRRDNRVKSALDVDEFPIATFELTEPIEFGEAAVGGAPVSAIAVGDLTVHGVTRSVDFEVEAQLVDDTIVIVGSAEISFPDFGVTVPSAPIVLSADDFGVIELQLFLARS